MAEDTPHLRGGGAACWRCIAQRARRVDTLLELGETVIEEWVHARRWAWERGVRLQDSVAD